MRSWTSKELKVLRTCAPLGARAVALLLERTPQAIRNRAVREGVQLGGHDGSDLDAEAVALQYLAAIAEVPELQLCRLCGRRWARMLSTGMCRSCHLDELLDLHKERMAEEVRARQLNAARQAKRRLRVCESCGGAFHPRPSSTATSCPACARG